MTDNSNSPQTINRPSAADALPAEPPPSSPGVLLLRQRAPREKDDKYLDFIRAQPCCICGEDTTVEAAHIRTSSIEYGKDYTGMGRKSSDRWALPLCGRHHREQHDMGDEMKFWAKHGKDPFLIAMTLRSR